MMFVLGSTLIPISQKQKFPSGCNVSLSSERKYFFPLELVPSAVTCGNGASLMNEETNEQVLHRHAPLRLPFCAAVKEEVIG